MCSTPYKSWYIGNIRKCRFDSMASHTRTQDQAFWKTSSASFASAWSAMARGGRFLYRCRFFRIQPNSKTASAIATSSTYCRKDILSSSTSSCCFPSQESQILLNSSGSSVITPSTPFRIHRRISLGSFTVHTKTSLFAARALSRNRYPSGPIRIFWAMLKEMCGTLRNRLA